jgi:hypothetical protein
VAVGRLRQTNTGAVLAIAAGLFSLGATTWPAPVRQSAIGGVGDVWAIAVHFLGAAVLAAPFIASLWPRYLWLAKALLAVAGIALIGTGVATQLAVGLEIASIFLDILPGAVALLAAWLLVPLRRPEVERAVRETEAGRARRDSLGRS